MPIEPIGEDDLCQTNGCRSSAAWPAGLRAARLRRLDENADIFIFERTGDVSFANCGLPYYVGGAIADAPVVAGAPRPERFRDFFKIEIRTRHEVLRIDRGSQTIEVQNLRTGDRRRRAVRCLGAGHRRRADPAAACRASICPAFSPSATCDDVDGIHAWLDRRPVNRAVVVGAGYIGLEMVENLSRRGIAVTLLELADQVMPPADPEMVVPIQQELTRQGSICGSATAWLRSSRGQTTRSPLWPSAASDLRPNW